MVLKTTIFTSMKIQKSIEISKGLYKVRKTLIQQWLPVNSVETSSIMKVKTMMQHAISVQNQKVLSIFGVEK